MEIPQDHPKCEGRYITRVCMICSRPLDEVSKFIIETREATEFIISHGIHQDTCLPKYREQLKQEIEELKKIPPSKTN